MKALHSLSALATIDFPEVFGESTPPTAPATEPAQPTPADPNFDILFQTDSTYELISKVAYLIGIPKEIFEDEHHSPQLAIYEKLNQEKNARIIRHLCIIRTMIIRHFGKINLEMRSGLRTILSMPEYVPTESINQLIFDDISFFKDSRNTPSHTRLANQLIEINKIICDRINNCQDFFPTWVNWSYLRDLFIMPNGQSVNGTKDAAGLYYDHYSLYPYRMYINWKPQEDIGNLLSSDKKFCIRLYQWHHDIFTMFSKIADVKQAVKDNIYDFIADNDKVIIAVDCENSDPYKLCATLTGLDAYYTDKIEKIILFDDVHTATAWEILDDYTNIPVEHVMTQRLLDHKSLVDLRLTTRVMQEHYRNDVNAFIIVSSDSDYWELISSLPDAQFLMMIERNKCSPELLSRLTEHDIFFCYIDNFLSANADGIRTKALFNAIYKDLRSLNLNVREIFAAALRSTRVSMTPAEQEQFYNKHIRKMTFTIDADGNVQFSLKP